MTEWIDPNAVCGFTADDYAEVMADLRPSGAVWPRDPASVQMLTLRGLATEYARLHGRDCDLLEESYPGTATETITDWERVLGLPDPCTGTLGTLQERRNAVLAKMAYTGDPTLENIEAYLRNLGFDVEIEEGPGPFEFTVYAAGDTSVWFRASQSSAGDRLRSWGNEALECGVEYIKPAHTNGSIAYLLPAAWDNDLSIWDNGLSLWDVGVRPPT